MKNAPAFTQLPHPECHGPFTPLLMCDVTRCHNVTPWFRVRFKTDFILCVKVTPKPWFAGHHTQTGLILLPRLLMQEVIKEP